MQKNLEWIRRGKTGCTFATLFAKNPKLVGWEFLNPKQWESRKNNSLVISIVFDKEESQDILTWKEVRLWALLNGFYEEKINDTCVGLRFKNKHGVSWVQYFGPDSHVKTRQSPIPMLMFTNKLSLSYYAKVGFNGILHLAHAWYNIPSKKADKMWERSFKQTRKIIGHDLTVQEAAKTTFKL